MKAFRFMLGLMFICLGLLMIVGSAGSIDLDRIELIDAALIIGGGVILVILGWLLGCYSEP